MEKTFLRLALVAFVLTGISGTQVVAGRKVNVGRSVPASQQISMDRIDHEIWDQLLHKYVNVKGEVDYKAWHASTVDTDRLDAYLSQLSLASRSENASKAAKIAFWSNAYNAVTIRGILREYPTSSIRNHTARLVGYNIWHDLLLNVGGTPISLDSIEHKVLRKMGEPRIHFAIVCASHSCPRLLNEAYTATELEQQLASNTRAFFANRENFLHDVNGRRFEMSAILDWFGEDFGADMATRLATIAPYLPTPEAQTAAKKNAVRVSFLDYDWSLNKQKVAR